MMLQQQLGSGPGGTSAILLFTGGHVNDESTRPLWVYKDHHGNLQGPFSAANMLQWYNNQRLPQDLLLCGITPQTALQPLSSIPPSLFQPLNRLLASCAMGVPYSAFSMVKTSVQPVTNLPQGQLLAANAFRHMAQLPPPNPMAATGRQLQLSSGSITPSSASQTIITPTGMMPGLTMTGQQQQQAPSKALAAAPYNMRQGFAQLQTALQQHQQQHQQQPQVVVLQQAQPQPQQQQVLQGVVAAAPQPVSAQRQVLLLQQQQQQLLLQQQQSSQAQLVLQRFASLQPQQQVLQPLQGLARQLSASTQQLAQQAQQQQHPVVPDVQLVPAGAIMATAGTGSTLPASSSVSLTSDMLMGQAEVERQLQQTHLGRRQQWGPCTATTQARQYPGAEAVQQRLQHLSGAGAAPSMTLTGAAGAGLQVQTAAFLAQQQEQQHLASAMQTGRGTAGFAMPQQQQQQLRLPASSSSSPAAAARSMPMAGSGAGPSLGNSSSTAHNSVLMTSSSFNSLQQLMRQAAAGAAGAASASGNAVALPASAAVLAGRAPQATSLLPDVTGVLRRGSTGTDTPAALPSPATALHLVQGLHVQTGAQMTTTANTEADQPGAAAAAQLVDVSKTESFEELVKSGTSGATDTHVVVVAALCLFAIVEQLWPADRYTACRRQSIRLTTDRHY
jgi:hypothetical protein